MTKLLAYAILAIGIAVHIDGALRNEILASGAWPLASHLPYSWLGLTLLGYVLCAAYAWKSPHSLIAAIVGAMMLAAEICLSHSAVHSSVASSMAIGALPVFQFSIAVVGSIIGVVLSAWHRNLLRAHVVAPK